MLACNLRRRNDVFNEEKAKEIYKLVLDRNNELHRGTQVLETLNIQYNAHLYRKILSRHTWIRRLIYLFRR